MPSKRRNTFIPFDLNNNTATPDNKPDIVLPRKGKNAIQIKSPESKAVDLKKQGGSPDAAKPLVAPLELGRTVTDPKNGNTINFEAAKSGNNGEAKGTSSVTTDIKRPLPSNAVRSSPGVSSARNPEPTTGETKASFRNENDSANGTRLPFKSKLNIYAPKHIPLWLKAVNESYAVEITAPSLFRIDYDKYRATFGGTSLLPPVQTVDLTAPDVCPVYYNSLQPFCYRQYWHERLQNEHAAQDIQLTSYALYDISIDVNEAQIYLYSIKIPGLRENAPRVDLGDVVLIRPLVPVLQNSIANEAEWWNQTREGLAPGFTGQQHNAIVWSIIRRKKLIIVKLGSALPRDSRCNLSIPIQLSKCAPAWRAVSLTSSLLLSDHADVEKLWLRSMLFPESSDGVLQTALSKGKFDLSWKDPELNFEQKRAVQAVVDANYGVVPYLISGPPGTGKSKTIVETALQLLEASNVVTPHLLVCAPSDAAADTLLVRLSKSLLPQKLFRLNNWTRLVSEVPGEVLPYCYVDSKQLHSLPDFETLMNMKVVVTTCRDANMLINAGLTNRDLGTMTSKMLRAVAPAAVESVNFIHWTALLLDEAAQATEPEVLVPLSVITPLDMPSIPVKFRPQFVLAGDEHQLGPLLASKTLSHPDVSINTTGLETSLFQRVFERPLYDQHPLSRANGAPPLRSSMLPITRPPFTNLIRNYRSHPAILSTSSQLFYSDTLIPERPDTSAAILSWPCWPSASKGDLAWPVLFCQNIGPDTVESVTEGDGTGAGSLLNYSEADIVLDLVMSLLDHVNNNKEISCQSASNLSPLRQDEIIVMSPFNAQVKYLRNLFREEDLYEVRIGPLEAFQGLESRVVVLCTTRTRLGQPPHSPRKFVAEDKERGLGVVDEPKRFNVALTRAKEALIVVGNAETLTCTRDRCWLSFLEFCNRNGLFRTERTSWFGKGWHRQGKDHGVGKLEKALRYKENIARREEEERKGQEANGTGKVNVQSAGGFKLQGTMYDPDEMMRRGEVELFENENDDGDDNEGNNSDHGENTDDTNIVVMNGLGNAQYSEDDISRATSESE
ncbi:hypothetical protein H2198_000875 [Neophaeococcomyces mojaviensis]|uniref:Uncharacterized protein n=1 Tax=Neophaeococcomyces mojaviensis TaxID=3383035 RepID=A0ACC3AIP7_9EURO|nr:hypothetical protein H2198_000875 [Knufia sp. JES_112]